MTEAELTVCGTVKPRLQNLIVSVPVIGDNFGGKRLNTPGSLDACSLVGVPDTAAVVKIRDYD